MTYPGFWASVIVGGAIGFLLMIGIYLLTSNLWASALLGIAVCAFSTAILDLLIDIIKVLENIGAVLRWK